MWARMSADVEEEVEERRAGTAPLKPENSSLQMTDIMLRWNNLSKCNWGWLPLWQEKRSQSGRQSIQRALVHRGIQNASLLCERSNFSRTKTVFWRGWVMLFFSLSQIMNRLTLNHCYVCKKFRLFALALSPLRCPFSLQLHNKSRLHR